MNIEINFKRLSNSTADVAQEVAEYAYPKTVAGCWKTLDAWLAAERITQTTYNEIKEGVTFEVVEE
jgi:hypothetical protein